MIKKCALLIIFLIMQIRWTWEEVHTSQHFLQNHSHSHFFPLQELYFFPLQTTLHFTSQLRAFKMCRVAETTRALGFACPFPLKGGCQAQPGCPENLTSLLEVYYYQWPVSDANSDMPWSILGTICRSNWCRSISFWEMGSIYCLTPSVSKLGT